MINDFAFNQDKSVIFCATQEGDILRVDRGTEEIKIIYIDKEEVWNGILFFEDQLIFSSVEGTICCGNADKFEFSKIQNKQFEYTIPYLCMKDCTFLNLNAESEIDSKLKSELRKNGIQI